MKLTQEKLKPVDLAKFKVRTTPKGAWVLNINQKEIILAPWMIRRDNKIKVSYVSRLQYKMKCAGIIYHDVFPEQGQTEEDVWTCCGNVYLSSERCRDCGSIDILKEG